VAGPTAPAASVAAGASGADGASPFPIEDALTGLTTLSGTATLGLPPISELPPLPLGSQRLSLNQYRQLYALTLGRPDLAWPVDRDIAIARNAHVTNTADEMAEALASEYDYLEGDIRIDGGGTVVMAHDKGDVRGMSFEEWLALCNCSGRGIKMDFKESAAIWPALMACKRRGIDGRRLNINITVYGDPDANVSPTLLRRIRKLYPTAVINLSVSVEKYTPEVLSAMRQFARIAGQPAMFPLRGDLVTPQVVAALRNSGKIAIWNSPELWSPSNIDAETRRFRAMGVNGTIDLRRGTGSERILGTLVRTSVNVLGWDATLQILRAVTFFKRVV
jgi:hypothetical protein